MDKTILKAKKVAELKEIARTCGVNGYDKLKKDELIAAIMGNGYIEKESTGPQPEQLGGLEAKQQASQPKKIAADSDKRVETAVRRQEIPEEEERSAAEEKQRPQVEGILELAEGGFGFLRFSNFLTSDRDIYVSPTQIRRFNLKTGDKIKGISRLPKEGERFGALLYVNSVNGDEPGVAIRRPDFDSLTPVFPYERISLEGNSRDLSCCADWKRTARAHCSAAKGR